MAATRSRRRCRTAALSAAVCAAVVAAGAGSSTCWVSGWHVVQSRRSLLFSGRRASKGVGPVLDESDFELEDDSKKSDKTAKKLESILDAADKFAIKKDKQKKKPSSLMSLEDELKGMVLEDEVDLSSGLMKTARTGKVDVSLEGRLAKWATETTELITNPTKLQFTYITIFSASVALLVLAGIVTFASGAVHFKGEGMDYEERAKRVPDEFTQKYDLMRANRQKMMQVKDLKELYNPDPLAPDSLSRGMWGMSDSIPYKPLAGQPEKPPLEREAAKDSVTPAPEASAQPSMVPDNPTAATTALAAPAAPTTSP